MRLPRARVRHRIPPRARLHDASGVEDGGQRVRVEAVERAREAGGGAEESAVPRGVAHGAEAAHRESGDGPMAAAVERPEPALDPAPQHAGVEGLPLPRAVHPVGVEAGVRVVPAVGHHDDDRELRREALHVRVLGPPPNVSPAPWRRYSTGYRARDLRVTGRQQHADRAVGHVQPARHRHDHVEAARRIARRRWGCRGQRRDQAEEEGSRDHELVPGR